MVLFFAPWCDKCMKMKGDWDKLAVNYQYSSSVGIYVFDCTKGLDRKICTDNQVKDYPTIRFYAPENKRKGEEYVGKREYQPMFEFIDYFLDKPCNIKKKEYCSEKEKEYIEKQEASDVSKLEAETQRLEGMQDSGMTDETRDWVKKRVHILKELAKKAAPKQEL